MELNPSPGLRLPLLGKVRTAIDTSIPDNGPAFAEVKLGADFRSVAAPGPAIFGGFDLVLVAAFLFSISHVFFC